MWVGSCQPSRSGVMSIASDRWSLAIPNIPVGKELKMTGMEVWYDGLRGPVRVTLIGRREEPRPGGAGVRTIVRYKQEVGGRETEAECPLADVFLRRFVPAGQIYYRLSGTPDVSALPVVEPWPAVWRGKVWP